MQGDKKNASEPRLIIRWVENVYAMRKSGKGRRESSKKMLEKVYEIYKSDSRAEKAPTPITCCCQLKRATAMSGSSEGQIAYCVFRCYWAYHTSMFSWDIFHFYSLVCFSEFLPLSAKQCLVTKIQVC